MRVGDRDDRDRDHAAVCIMQLEASGAVVADLKSGIEGEGSRAKSTVTRRHVASITLAFTKTAATAV